MGIMANNQVFRCTKHFVGRYANFFGGGYLLISIIDTDGNQEERRVHRLVAETWELSVIKMKK